MENDKTKKCREDLKSISKIENSIINFELKDLIQEIVELSVKIIRFSDENDKNILKNFYNYYIPTYLKILTSYKSAIDSQVNSNTISELEKDTIKNSILLRDGLIKMLDDILKNDYKDISAEMKVFEEFIKSKDLNDGDFKL